MKSNWSSWGFHLHKKAVFDIGSPYLSQPPPFSPLQKIRLPKSLFYFFSDASHYEKNINADY